MATATAPLEHSEETKRQINQRFESWRAAHEKPRDVATLRYWDENINTGVKALIYDPSYWKESSLSHQAKEFLYRTSSFMLHQEKRSFGVCEMPYFNGDRKPMAALTPEDFAAFIRQRHAELKVLGDRIGFYVAQRKRARIGKVEMAAAEELQSGIREGYKRGKAASSAVKRGSRR